MSIDLESKEVKEAIDAAVAAAVEEATSGLKAKNQELLGKLKKAQQGAQIEPAELEAVERERDQLKAELTKAQKELTKSAKEIEALTKQVQEAEGFTSRLLVDSGLSAALVEAGVTNPVHQKAVKAMLAGQVQIAIEGDARVPKVGDKALAEYVKEWAASDEGKHFVTAPDGNGGGAGNGGRHVEPKQVGNWGGTKEERIAAIKAIMPKLTE